MRRIDFIKSLGALAVVPFIPRSKESVQGVAQKYVDDRWVDYIDKCTMEDLESHSTIGPIYRIISVKDRLVEVKIEDDWYLMKVTDYDHREWPPYIENDGKIHHPQCGPTITFRYKTDRRPDCMSGNPEWQEKFTYMTGLTGVQSGG